MAIGTIYAGFVTLVESMSIRTVRARGAMALFSIWISGTNIGFAPGKEQ